MKEHYDVAVFGVWFGYNYGSLLNGYATYKILKSFGKSVLMVQKPAAPQNDPELHGAHNAAFIKEFYDAEDVSPSFPYERLCELNSICDCFLAGSDQIWNWCACYNKAMYLPFAASDKKIISFATSFGHDKEFVPQNERKSIRQSLFRYADISVREKFNLRILQEGYGIKASTVFDPVFCAEKELFFQIAKKSALKLKEPFVLAYILDATPQKREGVLECAKRLGLKPVAILDGHDIRRKENLEALQGICVLQDVQVWDFLYAFKNASFVVTDSFHGTAFAIIFEKLFLSVCNRKRGAARFEDLLSRLGVKNRLFSEERPVEVKDFLFEKIDYSAVNEKILQEKSRSISWLKTALCATSEQMLFKRLDNMNAFLDVMMDFLRNEFSLAKAERKEILQKLYRIEKENELEKNKKWWERILKVKKPHTNDGGGGGIIYA